MTNVQRFAKGFPALVAGVLITSGMAQAAPVQIDMGQQYWSNTAVPAESGPWLRATFTQTEPDTVTLQLDRLLNNPETRVHQWAFNLDPQKNLNSLQINQVGGPEANVLKNANGIHVAGGSLLDIRFMWPANPERRFDGSHSSATFTLSMDGLTPEAFNFGSVGGHETATNLTSVAWLHNVDGSPGVTWVKGDQSSTSVIPLPPAAWAGGIGLALVGAYVRRRRH